MQTYAAEPVGDRAGRIRRTSRRVAGIKEHPNGHLHARVIRPLLRRHGPREVWFRRRTNRVKPSANVHLSVGFPAEVPCSGRICGLRVPFENSELRIAALNHKPVNRIVGHRSADFTSEFLKRCHKLLIVSALASTLFNTYLLLTQRETHCNASLDWDCFACPAALMPRLHGRRAPALLSSSRIVLKFM